MNHRKRILVGALDWGLGHATRCVPLINALVENGCEVTIASSGDALTLLRKEFSSFKTVTLPAYNVRYNSNGSVLAVMLQLPRLLRVVSAEHALLNDLLKKEKFDGIVSDNRYGLYSENVPSVIVTHQLRIVGESVKKLFSPLASLVLRRYVNRFDECWIPDVESKPNLSGALSHNVKLSIPKHFIGPLSRLNPVEKSQTDLDLLILLSGPEPQRAMLEQEVLKQVANTRLKTILVQGLVNGKSKIIKDNVETRSYASAQELEHLVSRSKFVVARSGYSSVMDLCRLGGKALLVPTPGQPEQEYIARHLSLNNWSIVSPQDRLDVFGSLKDWERLGGFPTDQFDFNQHKPAIADWLQRI